MNKVMKPIWIVDISGRSIPGKGNIRERAPRWKCASLLEETAEEANRTGADARGKSIVVDEVRDVIGPDGVELYRQLLRFGLLLTAK